MNYAPGALCALPALPGLGTGAACVEASNRALRDGRHAQAEPWALKACTVGQWMGCNNLAVLYAHGGDGVEKNTRRALELYARACRYGEPLACRNLGNHYRRGLDVEVDLERAATLLDKACAGDSGEGCNDWGLLLGSLGAVPERRLAAFGKACVLDNAPGCRNWATMLVDSPGSSRDLTKAYDLMRKECVAGRVASCALLGKYQLEGIGTEQDEPSGIRHLRNACAKDLVNACRWLGSEYLTGDTLEKDVWRGLSLVEKACRLGASEKLCKMARQFRQELRSTSSIRESTSK